MTKDQLYHKWFLFITGAAILLLFVRIGAVPIYILDEAKNAQCAREMWLKGDWIVPTFNNELRTDKPPLHYWFMRFAYWVAGANAGSARFFSAVAGVLMIVVVYFQTRKWAGYGVGFFAAASLVLSTHFLFEFRLSVPDPYLIFFTACGLLGGFNYFENGKSSHIIFAGTALGLAALAKGPVAYALPGLIFLVYIFIRKKWNVFRDPFLWLAGVIAIVVAFPWYYAVHVKTGGAYTTGFFLDHNINRFSAEKEGHGGPFFATILIVLLGMLPVSFLAISSLQKRSQFFKQPLYLFSCVVVGVYVLFFSISSTKLPNYPMPCYPFVAIMAGYLLKEIFEERVKIPEFIWVLWFIVGLAIPVGGYFALRNEPDVAHLAFIALFLLALPVGIFVAYRVKEHAKKSFIMLGASWMVFSSILLWIGYPSIYKVNPVSNLSPLMEDGARVLAYRAFNPAFNFNSKKERMIIPMARSMSELDSMMKSESAIHDAGGAARNIYLITRLEYLDELKDRGYEEIGRNKDLFELPTTVILVSKAK